MGACVWKAGGTQLDQQSILVQFDNGVTASHNLFTPTARATRTIHLVGTNGELEGDFKAGRLVLRTHTPKNSNDYAERIVDIGIKGDAGNNQGHGGGDRRLVADFLRVVAGDPEAVGSTLIEHSIPGHMIGFAVIEAQRSNRVIDLQSMLAEQEVT